MTKQGHYPVEVSKRAWEIYYKLRPEIETEENIGKMMVIDVDTGGYEIDDLGIEAAERLETKNPGGRRFGIKIGYKTVASFAGELERLAP
jgi:hypothetical protein